MAVNNGKPYRYQFGLAVLSSRVGVILSIGFLIVLSVGTGLFSKSVVKQLGETQAVFEDRQIRNGYVAIGDIQRLLTSMQRVINSDTVSPDRIEDFVEAADIVYVRSEHLKKIQTGDLSFVAGKEAIYALDQVLAIADKMIAEDFLNLDESFDDLLVASELARAKLVRFLEDMRRNGDNVITAQSQVVKKQQFIMLGTLVGLTLVGSLALILLRQEVLAHQARDKAEKRVEFLAYFDPLTKLPNRVQFKSEVQRLLRKKQDSVALLYIDLDDFKSINDTHGHAAGDFVLRRVGALINTAAARYNGFAARLAGDEFALVVPTKDESALEELCKGILVDVAVPFEFEGESLETRVSIGIATSRQVAGKMSVDFDVLSRVTDFALYASKEEGRNRFTVYDSALEKRFLERRAMLEDLPKAIANEELEVFLQPKVELPSGEIYGFEALVRWNRRGQMVNPGDFILLAEECGLVVEIDNFVLNQAARVVARYNELLGKSYSVSVNLSALHFNSRKVVDLVSDALWRSDLEADLLTLEITETTEMRDWEQANTIIAGLHQLGCKISIDDFGTGFSSLAYLRTMASDELKVDRSLVEEIETSEKARLMLASVLEIARNMELEVVVEGIENEMQARIAHDLGAGHAQGFYFGRPGPANAVLDGLVSGTTGGRDRQTA